MISNTAVVKAVRAPSVKICRSVAPLLSARYSSSAGRPNTMTYAGITQTGCGRPKLVNNVHCSPLSSQCRW